MQNVMRLAFCLFTLVSMHASAMYHYADNYYDVDISTGYREDQIKWSIAGPKKKPNILSELKWNHIQSWNSQIAARVVRCRHFYMRGYADYARVYHGTQKDQDFLQDDKKLLFNSSTAKVPFGELYDFSGCVGYYFDWGCVFSAAPVIGWSYNAQQLSIHDLHNKLGFVTGKIPGLHNNFRAHWQSPFAGMDFTFLTECCYEIFGSIEFHWAVKYHGSGHWNLRTDFLKDFTQNARGWGQIYNLGFRYYIWDGLYWGFVGNFQTFHTGHGKDKVFLEHGTVVSRFNGIRWTSWTAMTMLGYAF